MVVSYSIKLAQLTTADGISARQLTFVAEYFTEKGLLCRPLSLQVSELWRSCPQLQAAVSIHMSSV